ncbi:unnamed protein product [Hymenolepis diminuta]|uniref:Bestrophin homolog n=1 Tax=Hymenolepis diminuta TaxID=6216 RepID=A0A0R3SQW0_HYMDI|nr:unnamed protein product [Hymenolepis diminuta]
MIFFFGLIVRAAVFLLPYMFLQSVDLAFTIIAVTLYIFATPELTLCLQNTIALPYVVTLVGLLIVAFKWVLFVLTLSCFEYLVIFEEFDYIFEDSLVSRLMGNVTAAIRRQPRFRVRSVTFNAYPNSNPPAFGEVVGQQSRPNTNNPELVD